MYMGALPKILGCFKMLFMCTVHGSWGAWTSGTCDVTCGHGRRTYTRACNSPSPKCSGDNCAGPNSKMELCNEGCCPGTKLHVILLYLD